MSSHECSKQQCTCSEINELTEVYHELRCLRKRVKDNDCYEQKSISADELQMTKSQAEHVLGIVKKQREAVKNLMTNLREFSQKLSRQEEMVCQVDKEIAYLRQEMCRIKEQYVKANNADECSTETISADEVAWRQALDLEIREQCRLKNKIKQLSDCLESHKQEVQTIDLERQEDRKADAKLLLIAMDYVEKCIQTTNDNGREH